MYKKNNCRNSQVDLSEQLKRIQNSICSINQTLIDIKSLPLKDGVYEQILLDYYELLTTFRSVLPCSYPHAKSKKEIQNIRQTSDLINKAFAELEYNPNERPCLYSFRMN